LPNSLTQVSLLQSTKEAFQNTTYTFLFTPTNPIPTNAIIQINYMSQIGISSLSCIGS